YYKAGRLEDAIACYHRALELQMPFPEAQLDLASAYYDNGDNFLTIENCDEGIAQSSVAFPQAYFLRGRSLYETGHLEAAAESLQAAVNLNPDMAEAHRELGLTLYDLGDLDGAVTAYRKAVELRPDYILVHHDLGTTLYERGHLEDAIRSLRSATGNAE